MSDPKVEDIGELTGDIAVFGGVYSNIQALNAFCEVTDQRQIPSQNRVFTGDAVAYCADPVAVAERLDGLCHWLAGNCEVQLANMAEDCGCGFDEGSVCDRLAAEWYAYAAKSLGQQHLRRMAACADIFHFRHMGKRVAVIHGSARDNARYVWPVSDKTTFQTEIDELRSLVGDIDIVLAGHSGIAFQRDFDDVTWVNAGALGMPPNDGRQQTRYAILGLDGVSIHRLSYDVETAARAIEASDMSTDYAQALRSGYWPSEDILPSQMRRI